MSARGDEIAIALASAYSGGYAATPRRISQNIVVARTWATITKKAISSGPVFDHAAIVANSIKVYLMSQPESVSGEDDSRNLIWINYPIQVGLAAYVKTTSTDDIDPLRQVSQELRDYCLKLDPAYSLGIPEGVVGVPEITVDPDFETLQTEKLFLSVFNLSFLGARSR